MWLITLALRNARRNGRRSMLTAATVIIGVAMFVLTSSFIVGVFENIFEDSTRYIGHVRVLDPDFLEREQLQPLYEYVPSAVSIATAIEAQVPDVHAYPIIRSGVAVSVDDTIGDVFAIATGTTDAWLRNQAQFEDKLIAGEWPDFAAGEFLVGRRTAEMAGIEIGMDLVLFGTTQDGAISPVRGRVAGIVSTGVPNMDKQVFMSLEAMQYTVDIDDGAIEILVYGDDLYDAPEIAAAIEALPEVADLAVQPWTSRPPFDAVVGMTGAIQGILGGILIFITSLAIWNTMTMSVLERTGEIGVMRAMGLGRASAMFMFVVEALVIAAIGGVIGLVLGTIPALLLQTYGVSLGADMVDSMDMGEMAVSARMYGKLTVEMLVQGFVVGLLMALAGSFFPSLRAASISPVSAMQGGR